MTKDGTPAGAFPSFTFFSKDHSNNYVLITFKYFSFSFHIIRRKRLQYALTI